MSQRAEQVAEELRKIISRIFIEDMTHVQIGFVTVTRIELTDDLRFGRVYYSVLGDQAQKAEAELAIQKNESFIRKLVVERLNMKYATELRFERDDSVEQSLRIDEILKKIKEKEDKPKRKRRG